MKNKKMIVVDLDGTLLNINQVCSNKSKKYLKRLKDLGYIVVIATGRMLRSAFTVTGGAEFANYIIASTGAIVYDMDNKKIITKKNIRLDDVKRICSCYNDEMKFIDMYDLFNHYRYMSQEKYISMFEKRIDDIDKFIVTCDDIYSIVVELKSNDYVDKYYNMFDSENLDILIMQDSYSDEKCVEIYSKGVSKYNAIREVMKLEGISNEDVITFGDGLNDVDMVKLSGIGVAMGNALEEVKSVSDYVTISHNNDGVIYFLKRYLEKNNLIS